MNLFRSRSKRARQAGEGPSRPRSKDPSPLRRTLNRPSPPPPEPTRSIGSLSAVTMRCVLSPSQAQQFNALKRRTLLPTKFIGDIPLHVTSLFDRVFTLLRRGGLGSTVGKSGEVYPRLTYEFLSILERHSSLRGYANYHITFNAFNYTYSMTYP